MATSNLATWARTPRYLTAVATAAVSGLNTDAPTNTVQLVEAGAAGSIIERITATARATSTASCLVLLHSDDGGTTKRLIATALLPAHTVANTTAIQVVDFGFDSDSPLRLGAGDQLYVGSMVALAGGIVFAAQVADF